MFDEFLYNDAEYNDFAQDPDKCPRPPCGTRPGFCCRCSPVLGPQVVTSHGVSRAVVAAIVFCNNPSLVNEWVRGKSKKRHRG